MKKATVATVATTTTTTTTMIGNYDNKINGKALLMKKSPSNNTHGSSKAPVRNNNNNNNNEKLATATATATATASAANSTISSSSSSSSSMNKNRPTSPLPSSSSSKQQQQQQQTKRQLRFSDNVQTFQSSGLHYQMKFASKITTKSSNNNHRCCCDSSTSSVCSSNSSSSSSSTASRSSLCNNKSKNNLHLPPPPSTWLKRNDFKQFKQEHSVIVRKLVKQEPIDNQTQDFLGVRTPQQVQQAKVNSRKSVRTVLQEQQIQIKANIHDIMAIAIHYERQCITCQQEALCRGEFNAVDVQEYMADTRAQWPLSEQTAASNAALLRQRLRIITTNLFFGKKKKTRVAAAKIA